MELGISTFVETTPDVNTGETLSHAQRCVKWWRKSCSRIRWDWMYTA